MASFLQQTLQNAPKKTTDQKGKELNQTDS